jgi:hypothetical protein
MAKFGKVQNGLAKTKSNGLKRKSNPLTLARVKGFAKANGLKVLPKSAALPKLSANPKHKKGKHRRRRNGLTSGGFSFKRNGLFGNTKSDVKQVGSLLGGMVGGKAIARVLQQFVAPYLAQVGLGAYAEILSDGAVALAVAPYVANKLAGAEAAKMARLGGLANVVVDIIEMVAPNALSGVLGGGLITSGNQVGLAPSAVAALVANTSATQAEKAAVSGAMMQLEGGTPINYGGYVQPTISPMYS